MIAEGDVNLFPFFPFLRIKFCAIISVFLFYLCAKSMNKSDGPIERKPRTLSYAEV
jgi:hypothetical protein